MAHEIQADDNTFIGYSFLTSEFYIRNLGTRTAAKDIRDAKMILDITSPFNKVSIEEIQELQDKPEPITSINYTWEDSGRYIKTIYFNDYKTFAMQYDEPSLYIRTSNEMWNMATSVSKDAVVRYMWEYYRYHLGLAMDMALMDAIISYYVKIQKPYVYNEFEPKDPEQPDLPLKYSNRFVMNNADKSSRGEYSGTKNPDNVYSLNVYNIYKSGSEVKYPTFNVSTMEKSRRRIHMAQLYPEGTFTVGEKIFIVNTGENNGEYTIESVVNDTPDPEATVDRARTHLTVAEKFPEDFTTDTYTQDILEKHTSQETLPENSITCTEEVECDIDDLIQVIGKNHYFDNLTVARTEGNKIFVNETISGESQRITLSDEAKVWINAYGIIRCGYDTATEVLSSKQVRTIDVANKRIYMYDTFQSTDYYAGEKIWFVDESGKTREYTVASTTVPSYTITDKISKYTDGYITINETPIQYTYNLGDQPCYVQILRQVRYPENSLTLNATEFPLVEGDVFDVFNHDAIKGVYTVDSVDFASDGKVKVYVVRGEDDEDIPLIDDIQAKNKAILQIRKYSERILLDMTFSKRVDKMPMGQFMLDNNQQFTEYLEMYRIIPPVNQNYVDLNQPVIMKYYIGDGLLDPDEPTYMNCVGLYSDNYKNL